ncbi:MAG: RNA polymerase sigma-70 factor [Bacteroidales bacterium]|nr:RNA polymerase sigma-70 factor [Bacteroidales bacterium]
MTEKELQLLVEGVKSGDKEAFNKLFRHFYAPLLKYCFRYVADEDDAAEIVQDFFVKLWANHENLSIHTSFNSYMMQSVRNLAITFINKERSHAEANLSVFSEEDEVNDPSEEFQGKSLEEAYQQVLSEMPEKRREVFVLSRFDGLKYSEIAERLNLSQKTVEAHMSAAIKQLREGLKDYI